MRKMFSAFPVQAKPAILRFWQEAHAGFAWGLVDTRDAGAVELVVICATSGCRSLSIQMFK